MRLILGGKDKGADWTELVSMIRERARQTLLVGQATEILKPLLAGAEQVVDCGTVRNAVKIAFATAERGDVVLLSPACASFDQYRNFEERGEEFRQAVESLEHAGADDA